MKRAKRFDIVFEFLTFSRYFYFIKIFSFLREIFGVATCFLLNSDVLVTRNNDHIEKGLEILVT